LVREAEGRKAEPSACVIDAQSVKTSANVPAPEQGIDAGKEIAGRKRHIGVDTLGLLLVVWVSAASASDNTHGIRLLDQIAAANPRVTKAWADTGYCTKAIDHGARHGTDVEVVQRDPGVKGTKVIPRRWVVERTFGWLMHHRRLAREDRAHSRPRQAPEGRDDALGGRHARRQSVAASYGYPGRRPPRMRGSPSDPTR
jgi:transposase